MIKPVEFTSTVGEPTAQQREAARQVILAHDPTAVDILEILGLEE